MAIDASMDIDMDIDLTLDQEMDPEIARLHAEAAAFNAQPNGAADTDAMNVEEEIAEEGEVDANAPVAKVHLRGVDRLTTQDVRNYAHEHYPTDRFESVQWVDDTSVNLIYDTETTALQALAAFAAEDEAEPLKERTAKRLITHQDAELFVRQAAASDVKVKDARVQSRFYLMNPQHDPERPENKKRRFEPERNYRNRDYKRNRRDIGDDIYSRRSSREESFNVDLYDDQPVVPVGPANQRQSSRRESSGSDYGRKKVRYEDDLVGDRANGRLRNRSASPARDGGDGRFGFADEQPRRRTARPRSPTPPRLRVGRDNRSARDNLRKELFPDRKIGKTAFANGHENGTSKDLFPNHSSPPKALRELLPSHRRHDARDLDRETREVGEAIGNYSLDGADERLGAYSRADRRRDSSHRRADDAKPRDLFSRIKGTAPVVESGYGRLHDRPKSARAEVAEEAGFNFKGKAGRGVQEGGEVEYSFFGASRERVENPLVKELFPMKAGGGGGAGGKDLFDGRIKGRGSQRRRAEDLF
ncbi:hypothetical protein LTR08_007099 [Meristemomyces frigidus]|nr:hypothetical protein LTR08_007099 [Meristemomyces frigidus]